MSNKINPFQLMMIGAILCSILFFSPGFLRLMAWILVPAICITTAIGATFRKIIDTTPVTKNVLSPFLSFIIAPLFCIELIGLLLIAFKSPLSWPVFAFCAIGSAMAESNKKPEPKTIDITPKERTNEAT